jgi:hypothetical protein
MRFAWVLVLITVGCSNATKRVNPVELENAKTGATDWWVPYPQWSSRHEIEAYADELSYAPGERVTVMLSTAASNDAVTWRLLRTGWYRGAGARDIVGGTAIGNPQPLPQHQHNQPLRADWTPTFTIDIPADAISGVYALRLDSAASGKSSFVTLVVRQDQRHADLVFTRADFTDEAYNAWDGSDNSSSAYRGARWVSFDRPLRSVAHLGIYSWSSGYFVYEYSMVRWLERNGYDVTYVSDFDLHGGTAQLDHARALIVAGHNEYWSPQMRDHVEDARDRGLNLGLFGADLVDGEIRFWNGDARTFSRTVSDSIDDKNEWAWKSIVKGHRPHDNPTDTLTGSHLLDWCGSTHAECNTDEEAKLRLADDYQIIDRHHPIFRHVAGTTLYDVVGYEYETVRSDRAGIKSLHELARAAMTARDAHPTMSAYVAASGAKVINIGSMHWAHALDDWAGGAIMRASGPARPCLTGEKDCFVRTRSAAAQVTSNVLADFGAFAGDGMPGTRDSADWPR